LIRVKQQGWQFLDLIADFHLLLFLSDYLSFDHDIPTICASIINRETPLSEGYEILLKSMAGLEV
jgi:nuclear protein localization protein 4 homolog